MIQTKVEKLENSVASRESTGQWYTTERSV